MIAQATTVQRHCSNAPPHGFNDDGFLADTVRWTPRLAQDIAHPEGLGAARAIWRPDRLAKRYRVRVRHQ